MQYEANVLTASGDVIPGAEAVVREVHRGTVIRCYVDENGCIRCRSNGATLNADNHTVVRYGQPASGNVTEE